MHSGGQRWVHQYPQGEKNDFSKVVPRPLGMLKQVFLGHFEPVVAHFGPWKIPKCLENGPFQDQQCVKNGSKTRFSKNDPGPFTMLKQVVLANFEPVATGFGPRKIPKCPENGSCLNQKWVKNGSTICFSKSKCFWPVLTTNSHFSPKTALVRVQNSQTKANGCYTSRAA